MFRMQVFLSAADALVLTFRRGRHIPADRLPTHGSTCLKKKAKPLDGHGLENFGSRDGDTEKAVSRSVENGSHFADRVELETLPVHSNRSVRTGALRTNSIELKQREDQQKRLRRSPRLHEIGSADCFATV
jgi:hypothetical protein